MWSRKLNIFQIVLSVCITSESTTTEKTEIIQCNLGTEAAISFPMGWPKDLNSVQFLKDREDYIVHEGDIVQKDVSNKERGTWGLNVDNSSLILSNCGVKDEGTYKWKFHGSSHYVKLEIYIPTGHAGSHASCSVPTFLILLGLVIFVF